MERFSVPLRDLRALTKGGKNEEQSDEHDGDAEAHEQHDETLWLDPDGERSASYVEEVAGSDEETVVDTDEVVVFDDDMRDEVVSDPDIGKGLGRELSDNTRKTATHEAIMDQDYIPHPAAQERDRTYTYDAHHPDAASQLAQWRSEISTTTRVLSTTMRRLLSTQSQSRFERDKHYGRLDRSRLHTLNIPGRTPQKNIFMQQVVGKTLTTAIHLFVDQSGSMSGAKIHCARLACLAFGDALNAVKNFGVRFLVSGFDAGGKMSKSFDSKDVRYDRVEPLRIHIYKTVDENWPVVSGRLIHMVERQNNVDGESVRWAGQTLLSVKASRHILIVLSDGMPAFSSMHPGSAYRAEADLKSAVAELETQGVETWGVGIMHHGVNRFYPRRIIIQNVSDLETKVVDLLKKTILEE